MKKINKKRLLHKTLSRLYALGGDRRLLVFDAPDLFHLKHFAPVIHRLADMNDYDIRVTGADGSDFLPATVRFYTDVKSLPLYREPAAIIATEFGRMYPHWLDCPTIYFGHGIGPKLNYAGNESLLEFDYVFSSCQPVYESQARTLHPAKPLKIGLPILEAPAVDRNELAAFLKMDLSATTVVYAPSWSNNIETLSDIDGIVRYLSRLASKAGWNIILSPHPLLFVPERCAGKVFFEGIEQAGQVFLNRPDSPYSTLDLVKASDVTVSDISSILFEAMALDKLVIFDGNRELYDYSGALPYYERLMQVCPVPDWQNENDDTLLRALADDRLLPARQAFIRDYVFNPGCATEHFIEALYAIIAAR